MATFSGVDPRRKDERGFERDVRNNYLIPLIQFIVANSQGIGVGMPLGAIINAIESLVEEWMRKQETAVLIGMAAKWADGVNKYHYRKFTREFIRVADVDIRPALQSAPLNAILWQAQKDSVDLIKTVPPRFKERLSMLAQQYIVGETDAPLDLKEREKLVNGWIRKAGRNAGYNVRRIVRDQSNKLVGNLSRARQQMAGVHRYVWRTSEDDRVRETHAVKNGRIFQWDSPPPDTGHPGHDIQCRCVAIPHITIDEIRSRAGQGIRNNG